MTDGGEKSVGVDCGKMEVSDSECYKSWQYRNVMTHKSWEGHSLELIGIKMQADGKRVLLGLNSSLQVLGKVYIMNKVDM